MDLVDPKTTALLKSPRTVEACKRLGYTIEELTYKSPHDLKVFMGDINVAPDILNIRWKAFEDSRKTMISKVMKERK